MSIFNDNIQVVNYFQKLVGYWATGETKEQKIWILRNRN